MYLTGNKFSIYLTWNRFAAERDDRAHSLVKTWAIKHRRRIDERYRIKFPFLSFWALSAILTNPVIIIETMGPPLQPCFCPVSVCGIILGVIKRVIQRIGVRFLTFFVEVIHW